MTCKAGRELLRKVAAPTVAAITLMLCTALPAHAQASHSQAFLMVMTMNDAMEMNMYMCDMTIVTTPSGQASGQCTATEMPPMMGPGYTVTHAIRTDAPGSMIMTSTGEMLIVTMDIEELPGGTAIITVHN